MPERSLEAEIANLIINEVMRWQKRGFKLHNPMIVGAAASLKREGWINAADAKLLIKIDMTGLEEKDQNQFNIIVEKLGERVRNGK